MSWFTILSILTFAVIGVGAVFLGDRVNVGMLGIAFCAIMCLLALHFDDKKRAARISPEKDPTKP